MTRGAPHFVPRPTPGVWVMAGDSIVAGQGAPAGLSWGEQLNALLRTAGMWCTYSNAGHNGETSANMLTREAAEVIARYSSAGRFARGHACAAVAVLSIGVNDLANGVAEATLRANQNTWLAAARTAGFKVGTASILRRTVTLSVTQTEFDDRRLANNNYRRSQVGALQDFVIDFGQDPRLLDPDDLTYFASGNHPNQAGCAVMASYGLPAFASLIAST